MGSGESVYVAETGKIYTFSDDKSYLFYGQSEDLTAILNELIDQRLSGLTGSSTGKCTLLWEEEYTGTGSFSTIERTISIENLDKYKYVYLETDVNNGSGALSGALIPVQILLEDNTKYRGDELRIKYISDDTFFIEWTDLGDGILRIYGVE